MYPMVLKNRFYLHNPLTVLVIIAGMIGSSGVFAQGTVLEEIVVTAEFREADVQDTPIAITAVNSAMLEARSQTDLYQIAAQAPNVSLAPAPVGNGPSMLAHIRGVGQTDFNYAVDPGVGIYVDDIYYPTLTGSLLDLLDLDRVEILRGPQGTLSGKNSIGGAIKLFSKTPGDAGGYFATTYGAYNRIDIRGSADFTVKPDVLDVRIAGVSKSRDGYVDRLDYKCANPSSPLPSYLLGDVNDCIIGTEGGIGYTAGRVSMFWQAADNFEVTVIGDLANDDSEAPASTLLIVNDARNNPNLPNPGFGVNGYALAPFGDGQGTFTDLDGDLTTTADRVYYSSAFIPADPYQSYANYLDPNPRSDTRPFSPVAVPPIMGIDQWGISGKIVWEINDNFSLTSITAYREYDSEWAQDADASPINSQMLLQRLEHEQISQEVRLNGTVFDGRLDFTLGGFYFDQDGTLEANVNLYYAQLNFIHGPDPTPSTNTAFFAHGVVHVTDRINLTGGVRYSEDEKTYVHFRRNPDLTLPAACPGPPPPGQLSYPNNCALSGLFNVPDTFEGTRWDGRAAIDFRLNEDIMTYAQYSTGYKSGGVNPRPFFLVQIENVQPESLESYELGFKSTLFDDRMRLNGAVFFNDYADIQLQQTQCEVPFPPFFGAPCLQPGNAGSADVWGFELETTFIPTDRLYIDAALSYLDFEYTEVDPNVAVTLDMVTPFTPEWKWSIGGSYEIPLGDMGSAIARIDASFQDEIYGNSTNAPTNLIDDYILVNGRLTWRSADEDWEAALEVTNLTDELYYVSNFDQFFSSGTVAGSPGLPRMWALTFKYNF
jgi:iron complex outermembrane receptor protein